MLLAVGLAIALFAAAHLSTAVAHPRVTKHDRIATRTYLEARLAYEHAEVARALASKADVEALASRLAGECPGVVAAGPKMRSLFSGDLGQGRRRSARQNGELNRQLRQRADLEIELWLALDQARLAPYREAALTFANVLTSLHWRDGAVTGSQHADAAILEWQLSVASPQVCADLRFWAASGYRSVSTATRTIVSELNAIEEPFWLAFFQPQSLLFPSGFEDASDRALAQRVERAEEARRAAERGLLGTETQLQSAIGLIGHAEAEARSRASERPAKGSVVIGKGRTAAGGAYTIQVESSRSQRSHDPHRHRGCVELEVEEVEGGRWSNGSFDCISPSQREPPTVTCDGGLLTIEAQTSPAVRRVRLTLSDGRQITSPVAIVPKKLGGPIGFYYQVVRGPSPFPAQLNELGARGKLLRSVRLPRRTGCKKPASQSNPFAYVRVIVAGRLRQGPRFLIIGRPRAVIGSGGGPIFGRGIEIEAFVADIGAILFVGQSREDRTLTIPHHPSPHPRAFVWRLTTGCQPHEYAILYGVLRDPKDNVFVRDASGLVPLRRARIPSSLRVHGVLTYVALPAAPSEVIVRTPAGKTVLTASLAGRAKRAREVCEGEAEPPAERTS